MPIRKSSISGTPFGATASRPSNPVVGQPFYNGTNAVLEIYTSNGWITVSGLLPGTPTSVVATNQPSGRAYNNGQASVAFSPSSEGGIATSFIVTPSPATSPTTFTGSSSPVVVTGLQSSTSYTYTVKASSGTLVSPESASSAAVIATTVPEAPSLSADGGNTQATLTLTGANGGSSITSWSITSNPATTPQTATSSPYTFTGLTNGTAYTFTATATNANGTSASALSNSVTPGPPLSLTAAGGVANSGNSGGNGGSGGGSAANSGGTGGGFGGYNGSNGQNGGGNNQGTGQLSLAYGSGTNAYIPVGGNGRADQQASQPYAGLGPNNYGSGLATTFNQQNASTRVSGYGRGCGGSEGGWSELGSAGQDGLVAWTNTNGGYGVIQDSTASWTPPISSTYTFYAIGGGGGGGGGYFGPGGSGYYATTTKYLSTSSTLTVTIGSGGSRGDRFGNGGNGGTTSVTQN